MRLDLYEPIRENTLVVDVYNFILSELDEKHDKNEPLNPFNPEFESEPAVDNQIINDKISFSDPEESLGFCQFIESLKMECYDLKTAFSFSLIDFFNFLKSFYEKTVNFEDIFDKFDFLQEKLGENNLIQKFTRIIFVHQIPSNLQYYEISFFYSIYKNHFDADIFFKDLFRSMMKIYIVKITKKYSDFILRREFVSTFCTNMEPFINAINGCFLEIKMTESDISKLIFIMIVFNIKDSIFMNLYSDKELFYCILRSLRQGLKYKKQIENFMATKLKWEFKLNNANYTLDFIYQTLFKKEYQKLLKSIKEKEYYCIYHKEQKQITTKVLQLTPKIKDKNTYSLSPLSKKIGEANQHKDNLSSKRELKFE